MSPLPRPALCLVTDRRAAAPGARTLAASLAALERQLDDAIDAGIDLIQIREHDLPARDLLSLAVRVIERASGTPTRVLVNDRADVALSAEGAGIHLKSDGPAAARVRTLAAGRLIGCSVHEPVDAARLEGADYALFGTVFPSASKAPGTHTAGVDALRRACSTLKLPVLAIGGVTPDRIAQCRAAGAAGVAAIGVFLPAGVGRGALGPQKAVRALRDAWGLHADRSIK